MLERNTYAKFNECEFLINILTLFTILPSPYENPCFRVQDTWYFQKKKKNKLKPYHWWNYHSTCFQVAVITLLMWKAQATVLAETRTLCRMPSHV